MSAPEKLLVDHFEYDWDKEENEEATEEEGVAIGKVSILENWD